MGAPLLITPHVVVNTNLSLYIVSGVALFGVLLFFALMLVVLRK